MKSATIFAGQGLCLRQYSTLTAIWNELARAFVSPGLPLRDSVLAQPESFLAILKDHFDPLTILSIRSSL